MTLTEKIATLERFKKTLVNLSFTASVTSDGKARVKFKKKIVIAECPDKDSAELFSESLNLVVKNTQKRVEEILIHLAVRCEQLTIFSKDLNDATITGPCGEAPGRTVDTDNKDTPREELQEGLFNRTRPGSEYVQYEPVGVDRGISLS